MPAATSSPTWGPPDGFVLRCSCSLHVGAASLAGRCCRRCGVALCLPEPAHEPGPIIGDCRSCAAAVASTRESPAEAGPPSAPLQPTATKAASSEDGSAGGGGRARILRRARRNYRSRPAEWQPWAATIGEQLAGVGAGVELVHLIGERPARSKAGVLEWATGELPDGWRQGDGGHYVEGATPVLRYVAPDGRAVELHRAAAWYGERAMTPAAAEAAHRLLGRVLVGAIGAEAKVLATPSATGRYLLLRTIPYGAEWPVLADELQDELRATSGQGRIELFDRGGVELPELVEMDARVAYLGSCGGLGAGVPVRDRVPEYAGQQRGRYLATFTVPKGWAGPGLLGVAEADGYGWRWPAEPGESGRGWWDGVELGLALAQGWPVTIHERILFPAYSGRGPLDTWQRKLTAALGAIGESDEPAEVRELARAGLRAIVLHTIGALHGRGHRVTRWSPNVADVPADAGDLRAEGGAYVWSEQRGQAWPEMAHPEWSVAIWARARARLLDGPTAAKGVRAGMLHVPPAQLVACRTDAIYLTAEPAWPDGGRPGHYRLKWRSSGPVTAPATAAELLAIRAGREGAHVG